MLVVPAPICTGTTSIHVQLYYTNTIYLHIYIYTNYNRCIDINPSLCLIVGGIFTTFKNCCLCSSLWYVTVTMACLCGTFGEAQCHVDDIKSNKCLCLSFSLYLKHFKQLDSPWNCTIGVAELLLLFLLWCWSWLLVMRLWFPLSTGPMWATHKALQGDCWTPRARFLGGVCTASSWVLEDTGVEVCAGVYVVDSGMDTSCVVLDTDAGEHITVLP